jgi:hypothetical protein
VGWEGVGVSGVSGRLGRWREARGWGASGRMIRGWV